MKTDNKIIGDIDKNKVFIQFEENSTGNTVIFSKGFKSEKLKIVFSGNNAEIFIGPNVILNGTIRICSDCSLKISEKLIANYPVRFAIGDHTSVEIGKDCMFSGNILFRTDDSHAIWDIIENKRINKGRNIQIKDHVLIFEDCKILKGSVIASGSVIACGTILAGKTVPNNVVASSQGGDVKIIRKNIAWSKPYINNPNFDENYLTHKKRDLEYWNLTRI